MAERSGLERRCESNRWSGRDGDGITGKTSTVDWIATGRRSSSQSAPSTSREDRRRTNGGPLHSCFFHRDGARRRSNVAMIPVKTMDQRMDVQLWPFRTLADALSGARDHPGGPSAFLCRHPRRATHAGVRYAYRWGRAAIWSSTC